MRPPKEAGAGGIHVLILRTANGMSGNKHQVPTRFNGIHSQPHRFTQSALDSVAVYNIANSAAYRKAKTAVR